MTVLNKMLFSRADTHGPQEIWRLHVLTSWQSFKNCFRLERWLMRQKQFIAMFWQTVKEMLFWVNDEWQVAELLVALEAEDFFFFFLIMSLFLCRCCFSFNAAGPIAHAIFQKFLVLKSFYKLWVFHTWFCVEFHFKLHLRLDKSFYTWPSKWVRANISLWMLLSESESGRSLVWSLWCPAAFAGLKYRQCCFNPTSPDDS